MSNKKFNRYGIIYIDHEGIEHKEVTTRSDGRRCLGFQGDTLERVLECLNNPSIRLYQTAWKYLRARIVRTNEFGDVDAIGETVATYQLQYVKQE